MKTEINFITLGFLEPFREGQKKKKRRTKEQILDDMKVRCPKCKHEWIQVK